MHFDDDEEEPGYMTQLLRNPMHKDQPDAERNTLGGKDDFVRRSTFSRTLTFSPETYHRAVVQPLEGLQRTFTEIGNRIDPDAQYTNALIDQYQKHSEGNEGDLPLQTGFARKKKFWKVIVLLTIISSFMGLVAAGFMNATEEVIIQAVYIFRFLSFLDWFSFLLSFSKGSEAIRHVRLGQRHVLWGLVFR
jgi:hypothetical protein